jgi:hypothetical protein
LCGAEIGALQTVNQKYLESMEMWCRRMMISWTDRVKIEEMLHGIEGKVRDPKLCKLHDNDDNPKS